MVIPTHLLTIFRTMMPLLFCTDNFAADTQKCWNAGKIKNQGGLPSDLNHWWAVNSQNKESPHTEATCNMHACQHFRFFSPFLC